MHQVKKWTHRKRKMEHIIKYIKCYNVEEGTLSCESCYVPLVHLPIFFFSDLWQTSNNSALNSAFVASSQDLEVPYKTEIMFITRNCFLYHAGCLLLPKNIVLGV